jgi:PAS domain S-box-containing protein
VQKMKDKNEIKELSEIYETIFDNAADGILIAVIENKKFHMGNKMICEMLGYSLEEIKNMGVMDIHPEEDLPYVIEQFKKLSRKEIELAKDIPVKRKDGSIFYVDIKSFSITLLGKPYLAGIFRDTTERKHAEEVLKEREQELEIKTHNLNEANIALKVLLKKREEDKTELEGKILLNIKELVIPYLEKLKKNTLDEKQKIYVSILESNLNDITSSFSHRLSSKYMNFTPSEIQIANLLRQGKTSKEIAELINSSPKAVAFHRENIRKKLGLKNKKINLKSYLLSLT